VTTVLIVEDDIGLRGALRAGLLVHDLEVVEAGNGRDALELVRRHPPDLMLLDLTLPGMDGLDVLRQLRAASTLPVVVLTVRDDVDDKLRALDDGADDYVTKPFDTEELLARIRAALRRTKPTDTADDPFDVDGVVIDVPARRLEVNGFATHLTPTEWRILEALVTRPGRLVTHRQLVEALSGTDEPDSPVVRVHVNHLRRKLGDQGARPRFIVNEYGLGYRWLPLPAD
jgi:two-component system, OmpR family, KDP operon response regulator KdpE